MTNVNQSHQKITVKTGSKHYPIYIGANVLSVKLPQWLAEQSTQFSIISNKTVAKLYQGQIESLLDGFNIPWIILPDGEEHKNWSTLMSIIDKLLNQNASRSTCLIALGGGVVGDMTGFAAACFMRGIAYIQIPTTLLAQVDSSIGGKTGINHALAKNCIGAIYQPQAVFTELNFLQSLPQREFLGGWFELVKHGLIRDAKLFQQIESLDEDVTQLSQPLLTSLIANSVKIKAAVVEQDELESGLRMILNFGHTLAHMIETHTDYREYLHGEAVGLGMLYAAFVSVEWGVLSAQQLERIAAVLGRSLRPIMLRNLSQERFIELIGHDKKVREQGLNFVVLNSIGGAEVRSVTDLEVLWSMLVKFAKHYPNWFSMA